MKADTFNPEPLILFCLSCKAEGLPWILPHACPHEWEYTGDSFRRWMETVKAKLRRK